MAMLIEAISLIIRWSTLDLRFSGGTDAFGLAMGEPRYSARLVCAEAHPCGG
jgi:hypothetical protein